MEIDGVEHDRKVEVPLNADIRRAAGAGRDNQAASSRTSSRLNAATDLHTQSGDQVGTPLTKDDA